MNYLKIKNYLISGYLILILVTFGFMSLLAFEGITDTGGSAGATVLYVGGNGSGNYSTIQVAIDAASSGDMIRVYNGTYNENLVIATSLTLIGNSSENTTIDGGGVGDVVRITANGVNICGFKISNSGNVGWPNYDSGIELDGVQNVVIFNNNCSDNFLGIYLKSSQYNTIRNNSCTSNNLLGMRLELSDYNILKNNTCTLNLNNGIGLFYSGNNIVENNTCKFTKVYYGIYLGNSDDNILINNNCNWNNESGIVLWDSKLNKIIRNTCNYNHNGSGGLRIVQSHSNIIENNICNSNNWNCIQVVQSNLNIIKNNTCDRVNSMCPNGITIWDSSLTIIINNTMLSNVGISLYGSKLEHWNTHTIDTTNTADGKPIYYWKNTTSINIPSDTGQVILAKCTNTRIENLSLNSGVPLIIGHSSFITIVNNTLSDVFYSIYLVSSNNNIILNNKCEFNSMYGIYIEKSDNNIISNNNFSNSDEKGFEDAGLFDIGVGIYLEASDSNIFSENLCNFNKNCGIYLNNSRSNVFFSNNMSENKYGILINSSSHSNTYKNNSIHHNNACGFLIHNSSNTDIYFNEIIDNIIQAIESGYSDNNQWDNGNGEGNYWSDYTGLDNGANGRIWGDGIGDTNIPHLELDNYPFINRSGWRYPGIPILLEPILDSDGFDSDGNFTVSWLTNRGTTTYILEEDISYNFDSPTIIYEGSELTFQITNKPNGTYYYRLKASNELHVSAWSNIVDIIVDWPPNIPKNFNISVFPAGNTLNISWSPNLIDTKEYDLYFKNGTIAAWKRVSIFQHPEHTYNHTGLIDGELCYYYVQARDARNQLSEFSEIVMGIPVDTLPPSPPTGLTVASTSYNSISLTWQTNIEKDLEGYCVYRSYVSNPHDWGEPIGVLSKSEDGFIDTEVDELTTYFYVITAIDEVPLESNYSKVVFGRTGLGPHPPEINNSLPDFNITEDTTDYSSINLAYWFKDINGDALSFNCKGNEYINVIIDQENCNVTLIPESDWSGYETITFYCSDGLFSISDNVTITVLPVNDPPETPLIISPAEDLEINEGKTIDFESHCFDPDLPYDDVLTFYWSSDITGDLGTGENLTDIKLPAGNHKITLTVTDSFGNSSHATINVRVIKADSAVPLNLFPFVNISIVLIIIIFLIVLFVFLRKKKAGKVKKEETLARVISDLDSSAITLDQKPSKSTAYSFSGLDKHSNQIPTAFTPKPATIQPTTELSAALKPLSIPAQAHITPQKPILSYQSKMIGRDSELSELEGYLEGALSVKGSTAIITGEAGIGKTRLIDELKQSAYAKGFLILSSNCVFESLTPYMPILKALQSGGLDHLFAEEAPRIEAVYLVTHGGVLIKEVLRQQTKLKPDIFASMLTAVGNFVRDSLSILSGTEKEGALNILGYENYRILIESGACANLVVLLTGKENEFLINDIKDIHINVEKHYESILKTWDGDEANVMGIERFLKPLIASGKYDGAYFGEHDPKTKRDLLFENVSMGLIRKSEEMPLLLCIEDLHWSDPSSLSLMHHLARNSTKSKLVILGTYRPEELTVKMDVGQHLTDEIQLMEYEGLINRIRLPRLPEECIGELLISILGGSDCSDDVKKLVYTETEGNPLFIIQLMKYLVEENIIIYSDGTWKLGKKVEELNIPPKVYQVIARRLDRLERKNRELLEYASVIGETFSSAILTETLSVPRLELLSQLRDLEQKYKLIQTDDGNYKFDHPKLKEVVYNEIPFELRMEIHSLIANTIERLNKDNIEKVIEDLAFHYYQSKNKEKAHFFLLEAAKKAEKNYSNSEAIRFYNSALELEDEVSKRRDILDSMGRIYDIMGEYDKVLGSFSRILEITEEPKKMADIKAKIGIIYLKKGDYDNSIRHSTEALDLVKNDNIKEEAFALETIGHIHHRKGEYEQAIKNHKRSLEIREKLNDLKGIATSLENLGMVVLDRGDYHNALKYYEKSLKLFEQLGDSQSIQNCLNNIGTLHLNKGDYNLAFEYFEKSFKIIETTGDQSSKAFLLLNIGHSLLLIGETRRALENLEKSLTISKNNDLHIVTACNYWVMAEAYIKMGNINRALDYCSHALELSLKLGNKEITASLKRVFGIIYKKQQNWELSVENFNESIKILKEIGNEKELGDTLYEFGLMWHTKGDQIKAQENFKEAVDIFKKLKLDKKLDNVKAMLKGL